MLRGVWENYSTISTRFKGYLGRFISNSDFLTFFAAVDAPCGKPKEEDSWFDCHVH